VAIFVDTLIRGKSSSPLLLPSLFLILSWAMAKGMFIVFEGIDGAGTTTQTRMLVDRLTSDGHPARLTFEPSGGRIGKLIRDYLSGSIDIADTDRHFHSLALLFAADRLDHLSREVEPRLEKGDVVVSDRYLLSSLVYQSLHCDREWVVEINREAVNPDITFLLDLPVDMAMERLARRNLFKNDDIYETAEQQERIRELYVRSARELYSDQEIIVLDGSADPEIVHEKVMRKLRPDLKARAGADQE